jgi:hypothetical protein
VRAGDQDASTELARMFEPYILRVIRFAMRRKPYYGKIRSRVGSSDICQSVFKSFFVGLKEGRFELDQPEQVQKLLRIMSRFKIATEGRRLSVILRDVMDDGSPPDRADSGPNPEKVVEDQDLAEAVLRQLYRTNWTSFSGDSTAKHGPPLLPSSTSALTRCADGSSAPSSA